MDVSTVATVIASILSVAALIRSYGEDRGVIREWRASVDSDLEQLKHHISDRDMHWTSREREAQSKQLDRIEELIKEFMTARSNELRRTKGQ